MNSLADILGPNVLHWESVLRLLIATVLGGLIGLEREVHGRSAGLRTLLIVAAGSALVMMVSLHFAELYGQAPRSAIIRADIARAISGVMGGVMGGVGFLGAGVIFRQGIGVRGLTTAASLWCTAAVGMACGFGMYSLALITTGIVLFALQVLNRLADHLPAMVLYTVIVTLDSDHQAGESLRGAFAQQKIRIHNMQFEQDLAISETRLTFSLGMSSHLPMQTLIDIAKSAKGVRQISVA